MKNLLVIGFLLVILFTIPITLLLVRTQTENRSHASAATRMSLVPSTKSVNVNDTFQLDIQVDPGGSSGGGANLVAFVDLSITYPVSLDLNKTSDNNNTGIKLLPVNGQNIVVLSDPKVTCASQTCTLKESLGMPPGAPINNAQPIATVYFIAKAPTDPNGQGAQIVLTGSRALSSAQNDNPSDNVLIGTDPSTVTISGQVSPTPTDASGGGGGTPAPTDSGGNGGGGSGGSGGGTQGPLCTSLAADSTSAASAPASITFTATGNSNTSTISKVTFNFGDGSVQDVTTGGGITTNAVNVQQQHNYTQTGTFTASATLTDANGNTSTPSSCSQTITVGQTSGGGSNPTPTVAQPLPTTGPGDAIVASGLVGAAIMVVGGLFLFGI